MLKNKAIYQYEKDKTDEIYKDKNRSKKVWEYIKKLKDVSSKKKMYNIYENGIELPEKEAITKVLKFWETVYQHHPNEMIYEWREDEQNNYRSKIDKNQTFNITIDEIKTQLNRLKENKAAGPDNVQPRLIKELSGEDIFIMSIEKAFNIIYNENRIPKSWKISKTTLLRSPSRQLINLGQ